MHRSRPRPTLALALFLGGALGAQESTLLASRDQDYLQHLKPSLGLASEDSVRVAGTVPDPLMEGHDARVVQFYKGVKVLGGEAILHMSGPRPRSVTDALVKGLALDPTPLLPAPEAVALALSDLGPAGGFKELPKADLVVVRLEGKDALAYRIRLKPDNGASGPGPMDYLVDAHTGALLRKWSSLRTGRAAKGQGNSQYSGVVALNTTSTPRGFELRDWTRGRTGNTVLDMDHGTGTHGGKIFTSTTNTWGDGLNYSNEAKTASANGETAAVDAAFGLQVTWDYYNKVFGRKGIDGKGTALAARVHYGIGYDNAFWSDDCFCITFGDGTYLKSLESMDVVGHELSHGVCSTTANLEYFGESGGLNEANSDINGTLIEFYARGGAGERIGNWGGNWTIGEDLDKSSGTPRPIRYLYKPSKDGSSADDWSSDLQFLDVHHSSGPMNRCFYFLSAGASPNAKSDFYTCHLKGGMEGLGNDRAAQIWFRAMTHYLTSFSGYKEARKACITAAQDLYGPGGPEEKAVWNAFHGIAVGGAWKD
jgi:Zn-dependent metalloprotease